MTFGSVFGRVLSPTFQPKSQAAAAASTFVPTDISGCALWLDFSDADTMFTDAGSTKVANDGDLIYQINDKSGNGYNASQSSAGYRPAYKINIKNGLSTGKFNDDKLTMSDTLRASLDKTVTYFGVQRYDGAAQDGFGTRYYTADEFLYYQYSNTQYRFNWGKNIAVEPSSTCTLQDFYIKGFKWNSPAQRVDLYNNGVTSVVNDAPALNASLAGNATKPLTLGVINSGGIQYFAELVVYTAALSDNDMTRVVTYLNNKWAIY